MSQTKKKEQSQNNPKIVDSLLSTMKEGQEYASICNYLPKDPNISNELKAALKSIENIRKRQCICYVANTIKLPEKAKSYNIGIDNQDDLPFNELISSIDDNISEIDIILVTPGGSGQQVSQFVNNLRNRFNSVEFILPYKCMSAGTLFALSGNNIWMDERAYIGPIDPQTRLPNGQFVSVQTLMKLLDYIKIEGEKYLSNKQNPPYTLIRLLDNLNHQQLGDALTQSEYAIKLATQFLAKYKFESWIKHKSGKDVTEKEKTDRAEEIAKLLCSHEYWKSHGHGITRDVAESDLKLHISKVEDIPEFENSLRRLWALIYYIFDGRSSIYKIFFSQKYTLFRTVTI